MANDVKQRMIERTALLLAKKGLQGASFSEILQASGAPRGSLYHHFPGGKDELVLAALDFAGARATDLLAQTEGKGAAEVAEHFIALWRSVLERSNFSAGCGVVAVTVAAEENELRTRAAAIFRSWRQRLTDLLEQGGAPAAQAPALAVGLIAACEGAVILARAEQSMAPFDLVAAQQLEAIRAAAVATPPAP